MVRVAFPGQYDPLFRVNASEARQPVEGLESTGCGSTSVGCDRVLVASLQRMEFYESETGTGGGGGATFEMAGDTGAKGLKLEVSVTGVVWADPALKYTVVGGES